MLTHCKTNTNRKCLKEIAISGPQDADFSEISEKSSGNFTNPQMVLKRCVLIFSDLIFESRVDRGMPSLAAAPEGPDTRPLVWAKAASILSFSRVISSSESGLLSD